jgi:type 1 fimbria pilin
VVNQFYFANITLNGTNTVTAAACSVTASSVNVPLGDTAKVFTRQGTTTASIQYRLVCDKSASINVQFNAAQDPSNIAGVMKLITLQQRYGHRYRDPALVRTNGGRPVQFGQQSHYYICLWWSRKAEMQLATTGTESYSGKANATATFTLS